MGNKAQVKRGRKAMREALKSEKDKDGTEIQIPDQWSTAILQFCNSQFVLRGDEPKELLMGGQLLVKCNKMAVVPLEHYSELLELAKRGMEYEKRLREALPQLVAAKNANRALLARQEQRVIPVSSMPQELKS